MSHPSHDPPGFKLLDLRAEVSSFFTVLADLAFIIFYLLALCLQLVDEVVLDDRESCWWVVRQCLHHYGRKKGRLCQNLTSRSVPTLTLGASDSLKCPYAHQVKEALGCFGQCGEGPHWCKPCSPPLFWQSSSMPAPKGNPPGPHSACRPLSLFHTPHSACGSALSAGTCTPTKCTCLRLF